MFKNAIVYRIDQWEQPPMAELETRLDAARFVECGASQQESFGWVEPRGEKHGPLVENVAGQWILKLCTETKAVPGGAVKTQLEARLDKIEQETGRRPKGKHAKEIKEEVIHELLPRAFPKRGTTPIWIDLGAHLVMVGVASPKKADKIITSLTELLAGGIRLDPLQTQMSPATAMSEWLSAKEAPAGFSIDRECELKQPDSEKALVRYARHTLDIDEVGEHIKQGKLPTSLAMTWDNRVSFVLTEALTLKKIKLLDVVLEGQGESGKDDNGFDADVAISTGELAKLIPDLVDALGGPLKLGEAGAFGVAGAVGVAPTDKLIAVLTGQPSEKPSRTGSVYAPPSAEDASAPF
jgi:recombination associated protein RdgC